MFDGGKDPLALNRNGSKLKGDQNIRIGKMPEIAKMSIDEGTKKSEQKPYPLGPGQGQPGAGEDNVNPEMYFMQGDDNDICASCNQHFV